MSARLDSMPQNETMRGVGSTPVASASQTSGLSERIPSRMSVLRLDVTADCAANPGYCAQSLYRSCAMVAATPTTNVSATTT